MSYRQIYVTEGRTKEKGAQRPCFWRDNVLTEMKECKIQIKNYLTFQIDNIIINGEINITYIINFDKITILS